MPFFVFRLQEINPKVTRSVHSDGRKAADTDVVTFAVLVNQRDRGQGVSTFTPVFAGGQHPAAMFPPTQGNGISRQWRTRAMEIAPGDGVTVIYTGTNISDKDIDLDAEKQAEIEVKILNTLVTAAVGAIGGAISAAVGGILGLIGDPVGKLLGFATTPKCDGVVFSDTVQFTGAGLTELTFAELPPGSFRSKGAKEALVTKSYTDVATHDKSKCGAVAETDVTFSVVQLPAISLRFWVPDLFRVNLKQGLRQIGPPDTEISLRSALRL